MYRALTSIFVNATVANIVGSKYNESGTARLGSHKKLSLSIC